MTNPGSLTMGFAGADPRQLAPSVGTAQVGTAISAASSSASINAATPSTLIDSTTRANSDLFGSLDFMAHLPAFRPTFADQFNFWRIPDLHQPLGRPPPHGQPPSSCNSSRYDCN